MGKRIFKESDFNEIITNRFNSKLQSINKKGCILWKGNLFGNGYGMLSINRKGVLAHRYSYALHYGIDPKNLCVLHKCDTPACVNPSHLFLGTIQDNLNDMKQKGRSQKGENHFNSKLLKSEVYEIKKLLLKGINQDKISKKFNVGQTEISAIATGRIWNVMKPEEIKRLKEINKLKRIKNAQKKRKLSNKQVYQIRALLKNRKTCSEIAPNYGIHRSVINNIKLNKYYIGVQL